MYPAIICSVIFASRSTYLAHRMLPYACPRYPEGSVSRQEHMQCHALYTRLCPRPGGMRLQLGETRRVAGQRHQRTLPVVTPA